MTFNIFWAKKLKYIRKILNVIRFYDLMLLCVLLYCEQTKAPRDMKMVPKELA